jgi:hypothetical protein
MFTYVDGVPLAQPAGDSCATRAGDSASPLHIGYMNFAAQSFGGTIDEVRVYNRVLSANEIRNLYGAGR